MSNNRLQAIKTVALSTSIVIVLSLFVNLGVQTFYPSSDREDFCPREKTAMRHDQSSCEQAGGIWIESGVRSRPVVPNKLEEEIMGYCDSFFTCEKEYQSFRDVYNRNVFLVLVVAGLISIAIGYAISAAIAVSSGFVFGGVLLFIIGTIRYWSGMQDYLRFIIVGIVLAVLVWIGYTKLKK